MENEYDDRFPELYPWGQIDSRIFSELCPNIAREIAVDFKTKDRNLVPGLRLALNMIHNHLVNTKRWEEGADHEKT